MDGAPGTQGHGSLSRTHSLETWRDSALPGSQGSGQEVPLESWEDGRECVGMGTCLGNRPPRGQGAGARMGGGAQGTARVCRKVLDVPGQRWTLVLQDLAPALPGVGSRHAQLAFPICSPIHRTGRAERLLGCERALQTTPASIRVLLETEIRSSPLESITFRQWSCSLKSGHRGCTSLSSVALVTQVSSTVP